MLTQLEEKYFLSNPYGFQFIWLLISLCAPKIGQYKNSDENSGNLEEGDLLIDKPTILNVSLR